jgi:hypothetical protein
VPPTFIPGFRKTTGEQKNTIDANVRDEHRAVLFKSGVLVEKSPWRIPTDWVRDATTAVV